MFYFFFLFGEAKVVIEGVVEVVRNCDFHENQRSEIRAVLKGVNSYHYFTHSLSDLVAS
jgi:hypothetical protein